MMINMTNEEIDEVVDKNVKLLKMKGFFLDGYGDFSKGLEDVQCIDGTTYKAKTFTNKMDEKELFAAEITDRNHVHHDKWLLSFRGDGIGSHVFMMCQKCKAIFDLTNYEHF
jgi:hypothetical protein